MAFAMIGRSIQSGHMSLPVKAPHIINLFRMDFSTASDSFRSVLSWAHLCSAPQNCLFSLTSMLQKCWTYNCCLNPQYTLSSVSLHFPFSLELSSHYLFPSQLLWLSPLILRNLSLFLQPHPTLAGSSPMCSHSTLIRAFSCPLLFCLLF